MRFFLFFFIFIYTSLPAIVDIATVDFEDKSQGFSGSAYGSFQLKRGNTDKDESEYGGRLQYNSEKSITWLQGESEKDKVRGTVTDDNAFVHLRHIHQMYTQDWAMEYYGQYKKDEFKSVKNRTLLGIGPRYRVLNSKDYGKFFLGVSLLEENIDYISLDPLLDPDPDEHNYRVSSYISYNIPVNKTFDLSFLAYYQPKINNGSDYLTSAISEMTVHLTKVFDLSYLIEFDYDSQPATDIKKTDIVQKLSFIYRFGEDDPFSSYAHNFIKSLDHLEEVNTTAVIAVEVETKLEDIKDFRDTFAGVWSFGKEVFHINLDGKGVYRYDEGIYTEKLTWKLISTDTQEGTQAAKDQSTKLVIIRFIDEEGRPGRVENYLWSESAMVGLSGSSVRLFKRP